MTTHVCIEIDRGRKSRSVRANQRRETNDSSLDARMLDRAEQTAFPIILLKACVL